jgi:hypothetical protein
MEKSKRIKLKADELELVEFWANWQHLGRAIGITRSTKSKDEFSQYLDIAIANFDAESLFIAFEKADVDGWKRYVEEHPPTPEALACLITIGLENYRKVIAKKAGKRKGAAERSIISDAINNQGNKTRKEVVFELQEKGISDRTIVRHTAGKLAKNPKL